MRPWWGVVLLCASACADQQGGVGRPDDAPGGGIPSGDGACEVDCAQIQAPECYQSVCNEATGTCEVVGAVPGSACDDEIFCTVGEACDGEGRCGGGVVNTCGIDVGVCAQSECVEHEQTCNIHKAPDGTSCTADELCLISPTCLDGVCTGDTRDCSFQPVPDVCHRAECNPDSGLCQVVPTPDGGECDDGDDCTIGDSCTGGACAGVPKDCSFLKASCSVGVCDPLGGDCKWQSLGVGAACNATDSCAVGFCASDGACTLSNAMAGSPCDDFEFCTTGDACEGSVCVGSVVDGCPPTGRIAAGWAHTCALTHAGEVYCWGYNASGQLASTSPLVQPHPTQIAGVVGAVALATGADASCAVLGTGKVKCWGANGAGQLGNGSTLPSTTPVEVQGLGGVVGLSGMGTHFCAALQDGTARCWGNNADGQLGDGTTTSSPVPTTVTGLSEVSQISAGVSSTCAVRTDGFVVCWGQGTYGQLGNGSVASSSIPVPVDHIVSGARGVGVGRGHACAVVASGTVLCWGGGNFGQIGNGGSAGTADPVSVGWLGAAVKIAVGDSHACALLPDGTAACWGYNATGQLGNGVATNSLLPGAVSSVSGAAAMAAGAHHTCVMRSDGAVRCWGDNTVGQLGTGTFASPQKIPVDVLAFP